MQPVVPRPVGGETGGRAPGEILPPNRPGFLELQITAESLGNLIMNRLRAETICAGEEFKQDMNSPLQVVDHVEFHSPAVLAADPHPPAHGPGDLQLKISATLFIKYTSTLIEPTTTDEVSNEPGIDLFFNVTSEDGDLCISFNTFHTVYTIPHTTRQQILGALSSFQLCTKLDLSALPHVLGDLTAAKAKVGSDDGFTILSVRMDLGASEHAWRSFADAPVVSFLDGLDWGILLGSGLVVGVFEQMMASIMLGENNIALSQGPSGKWTMFPFQIDEDNGRTFEGGVSVSMEGDDWGGGCDIGFSAVVQAALTVPSQNQVRITIGLDFAPNYWDAFLCFGAGPIGDIIAARIAATHDLGGGTPSACEQKTNRLLVCDYPVALAPMTLGASAAFGTLVLQKYFPTLAGPVLGGKLEVAHVGEPKLHISKSGFAWGVLGNCGNFSIGAQAQLTLTGTELFQGAPVEMCKKIQVLNDTLGIFSPRMLVEPLNEVWLPLMVTFTLAPEDLPLDSPYWANPYDLVILVETSAGCRAVSLGSVPPYTDQEISNLGLRFGVLEGNCDAAQAGLFGVAGQFDPHWLVDPAPEGGISLWEGVVTGGTPGDAFALGDENGPIARSVVGAAGTAQLAGLFVQGGTLGVKRIAAPGGTAPDVEADRTGDAPPRLHERQVELLRKHEITLGADILSLAADRLGDLPLLIAATPRGVSVFDMTAPGLPRLIGEAPGARGAIATRTDLVYWGGHGLSFWSEAQRAHEAVVACVRVGLHFAALTLGGVTIFDAFLRPVGRLDLFNTGRLVAGRRRLVVTVPEGLAVVDIGDPARPAAAGVAKLGHVEGLSTWAGPRVAGTVTAHLAQEFVTLSIGDLPAVAPIATYSRRPWSFGAARGANFWARAEGDPGQIGIYGVGRTRTTYPG